MMLEAARTLSLRAGFDCFKVGWIRDQPLAGDPTAFAPAACSNPAVPLVSLIAPVPAVPLRQKHDPGQILRVLVAELHW